MAIGILLGALSAGMLGYSSLEDDIDCGYFLCYELHMEHD